MPLFPLVVTPDGATLDVGVSAPTAYVTKMTRPNTWTALVDTGATMSVISPAVRLALAPPSIGYFPVGRAGGVRTFEPTYEIRIRLGGHLAILSRWFALETVELRPATPDVDVIIGTDLLIRLELSWRGPAGNGFLQY
jgi:hypothetical protein